MLVWDWLIGLFPRLIRTPVYSSEATVSAYKDLLSTYRADVAAQSSDATTLAAATAAKAQSDLDVSASTVAFAAAVKAAPGGSVVDATVAPVMLYTSADGQTFTAVPIASITDPVPAPADPPASP